MLNVPRTIVKGNPLPAYGSVGQGASGPGYVSSGLMPITTPSGWNGGSATSTAAGTNASTSVATVSSTGAPRIATTAPDKGSCVLWLGLGIAAYLLLRGL